MKLPRPEHVSRNYPGKSASDSNYVTVRLRLSQLSGYISKFSSGLMVLLKFRRETPRRAAPRHATPRHAAPCPYFPGLFRPCLPANRCEPWQLIRLAALRDFTRETPGETWIGEETWKPFDRGNITVADLFHLHRFKHDRAQYDDRDRDAMKKHEPDRKTYLFVIANKT